MSQQNTSGDAFNDAAAARERGNDLYRSRQFDQAQKAYLEAARLAPEDPAPWSNMSAIKFELGDHFGAVKDIQKALDLSASEPEDGPKKQKLYTRMAKCYLYSHSLDDAEGAVKLLADDESAAALRLTVKEMKELDATVSDGTALRKQILDRLPRYKSHLQDVPEYYAMGHDEAESLMDDELRSAVGPSDDLAFLLCGSGDARHLFATILDLFAFERLGGGGMMRSGGSSRKFGKAHFTLVDINATALARTLVLFDSMTVYAVFKAQRLPRLEDALTCMAYTYTSAFVPPFVYSKMLESIKSQINILEKGVADDTPGTDVYEFLYLPKNTRAQVLHKLKQWAEPLDDEFAPSKVRPAVLARYHNSKSGRMEMIDKDSMDNNPFAKQCQKDFRETGVIFADQAFLQRREPELIPLLEKFRSSENSKDKEALTKHIDAHWKTNPTVLDLDYEPRRRLEVQRGAPNWDLAPTLEWDPVVTARSIAAKRSGKPGDGALKHMGQVFDMLAIATATMMERMKIEVIAGEMADVLERIRYGDLGHRLHKPSDPESIDPTRFPRAYDRIHMSNIPDYVGGPLTTHLYGAPLLRGDRRSSNLRFNNLLNPPHFHDHDQFLSDYLLMYDAKQIEDHFGLIRHEPTDQGADAAERKNLLASMMGISTFFAEDYFVWSRSGTKRIPRNRMMPRASLEHWLYSHLLKICTPYKRPLWSDSPVHAPLNLTAFFRLVTRMHEVGYPAHWLAGIVAAVCEKTITTTARPPDKLVLTKDDVTKAGPQRQMNIGPWWAEFTTLSSLWRRLLPFGIIAPQGALVPVGDVVECRVTFPNFPQNAGRVPHFTVVFYDRNLTGPGGEPPVVPLMIRDDEAGDASELGAKFRDQGVHIVTCFGYVTDTRTATFWLRADVVVAVKKGQSWRVGMCRTDSWVMIPDSNVASSEALQVLDPWTRT